MKKKNPLQRLFVENKSLLGLLGIMPIFIVLEIVLVVGLSHLFKTGIDKALEGGEGYLQFAMGLVGIIFFFSIMVFFKDLALGYLGERAIADLRFKATGKFMKLPISKLDTMHSGDNLSKLTNDIQLIKRFIDWDGYFLILRPLMAVASLAYLTYLSWLLTLASIALIPIMMFITVKISSPLGKYTKALQEELANINKTNQDILGGIHIIKSFNLKDRMIGNFKSQLDESVKRGRVIALRRSVLMGVSTTLNFLPFLMPMALGSFLVYRESMSVGALLAFINLLNNLTWPLSQLPNHFGSYKGAMAGLERIYEIIDMPSERQGGKEFDTESENVLTLRKIKFSYTEKNILSNLSFSVKKDETIALVGPSGGGKSTIFKLIAGFYQPIEGEIEIFDKPLDDWNLEKVREAMAMVSQDTYLFPTTIKENIALGKVGASMDEIIEAAKLANAHSFILNLPNGYDTLVGERGAKLSGGQKQRISIARAILNDAKLLLLDEATSALDTESELLVQQALEKAMVGRTTIVIAHRLSTIKNADRILVLEEGSVVEEGNHEELLKENGLYSKLYNKDFGNLSESGVA